MQVSGSRCTSHVDRRGSSALSRDAFAAGQAERLKPPRIGQYRPCQQLNSETAKPVDQFRSRPQHLVKGIG